MSWISGALILVMTSTLPLGTAHQAVPKELGCQHMFMLDCVTVRPGKALSVELMFLDSFEQDWLELKLRRQNSCPFCPY